MAESQMDFRTKCPLGLMAELQMGSRSKYHLSHGKRSYVSQGQIAGDSHAESQMGPRTKRQVGLVVERPIGPMTQCQVTLLEKCQMGRWEKLSHEHYFDTNLNSHWTTGEVNSTTSDGWRMVTLHKVTPVIKYY
jgi:hypothetical protein